MVGDEAAATDAGLGYDVEADREALHRLCPRYAQDVNSPLRHVRTRIYFTSESHMHSLLNVLRFSSLGECLHRLSSDKFFSSLLHCPLEFQIWPLHMALWCQLMLILMMMMMI